MSAYYNEHDRYAADWLRNLIDAGEIAPGVVDTRDIQEIDPDELTQYTQVHLFAGIGGWSVALRLAGWPDDRPICTGSCPCQPFSAAGKRKGTRDVRHLWPWMRHIIFRRRFPVTVGEQVASADGRLWLAGVRGNLETLGYVVGSADLCSPGAGADHIRQRLYWLADSGSQRHERQHPLLRRDEPGRLEDSAPEASRRGEVGGLADAEERGQHGSQATSEPRRGNGSEGGRATGGLEHSPRDGRQQWRTGAGGRGAASRCGSGWVEQPDSNGPRGERDAVGWSRQTSGSSTASRLGDANDARPQGRGTLPERTGERLARTAGVAVPCLDGKSRRFEPGSFPLAHGLPRCVGPGSTKQQRVELLAAKANRVGRLRGYGNAIDPYVAAEFIGAYLEAAGGHHA